MLFLDIKLIEQLIKKFLNSNCSEKYCYSSLQLHPMIILNLIHYLKNQ